MYCALYYLPIPTDAPRNRRTQKASDLYQKIRGALRAVYGTPEVLLRAESAHATEAAASAAGDAAAPAAAAGSPGVLSPQAAAAGARRLFLACAGHGRALAAAGYFPAAVDALAEAWTGLLRLDGLQQQRSGGSGDAAAAATAVADAGGSPRLTEEAAGACLDLAATLRALGRAREAEARLAELTSAFYRARAVWRPEAPAAVGPRKASDAAAARSLSAAFASIRGLERCFWRLQAQLALQAADRGETAVAAEMLSEAVERLLALLAAGGERQPQPSGASNNDGDGEDDDAADGRNAQPGTRDAATLELQSQLSALRVRLGDFDGGLRLAASAHAGLAEQFGPSHPSTLAARLSLAGALVAAKADPRDHAAAVEHAEACVRLCRDGDGAGGGAPDPPPQPPAQQQQQASVSNAHQLSLAEHARAVLDAHRAYLPQEDSGPALLSVAELALPSIVKALREKISKAAAAVAGRGGATGAKQMGEGADDAAGAVGALVARAEVARAHALARLGRSEAAAAVLKARRFSSHQSLLHDVADYVCVA